MTQRASRRAIGSAAPERRLVFLQALIAHRFGDRRRLTFGEIAHHKG